MEKISLESLLGRLGGNKAAHTVARVAYPDAVTVLETVRQRETTLRRFLPPQIVRRLDAGFARSNTVHPDTGRALYAICRACRPQSVFETGTYWGYSTAYLAAALRDEKDSNAGSGKVYTFDIYARAGRHIPRSLLPHIEMHRGRPSVEAMPAVLGKVTPGLFFQDSRHDYQGVADELQIVKPHLPPGAVVLFHDFVEPQVRKAAVDVLNDFVVYELDTQDPQQVGVALKPQG